MSNQLTRRDFIKSTLTAAAGVALASCTPQATPTTPAKAAEPTKGAASAASPLPATAGPAKKVKIEYVNMWGDSREPLMNKAIQEFNVLNPNIEIVNQVQSWDNRDERMATMMASSTPPGLMMSTRVETYKYAKQGLIVPIDDYVKASGINVDEIFYSGEINNQRWNGKLWSLPMPTGGGNNSYNFYNKKMVAEAGFDPEKGIQTWQDMEVIAKKLTKFKGKAIDIMGADPIGTDYATGFIVWLLNNNGQLSSPDGKQLVFNSAEGVETLEWLANYLKEYLGGIENARDFWANTKDSTPDFPLYKDRLAVYFGGGGAVRSLQGPGARHLQGPQAVGRWAAAIQRQKHQSHLPWRDRPILLLGICHPQEPAQRDPGCGLQIPRVPGHKPERRLRFHVRPGAAFTCPEVQR